MKVFVDTLFGLTFSFDLDPRTKVFDIKKSIENSQGIPVSMQTLYFNDVELVLDHYQLIAYRIVNNSHLFLWLRADRVDNQMLHQSPYAIQGFVPSMGSNQVFHQRQISSVPPLHASEAFFNQDLSMLPRSNQVFHQRQISSVPPSHASEAFYNQVFQTEKSAVPSNTFEDFSFGDYPLFSTEAFTDIQSHWPVSTTESIANKNHMFQTDQFSTFGDWSASTFDAIINKNQVFQTEYSPPPQKMTVIMTQYDKPGRKLLVDVNASDNVEELKKELVNVQQKYQLELPVKGYFLIHKERVLDDDKSFSMNRVAHGDTIEIFPGPVIEDYCTQGMDRTFGL